MSIRSFLYVGRDTFRRFIMTVKNEDMKPEKPLFDVPQPGPLLGTTEDCVVDDRGYIFVDTFHDGVYILKMKLD